MLILGQVRFSKGQICLAGIGKGLGQGLYGLETPAGFRDMKKHSPKLFSIILDPVFYWEVHMNPNSEMIHPNGQNSVWKRKFVLKYNSLIRCIINIEYFVPDRLYHIICFHEFSEVFVILILCQVRLKKGKGVTCMVRNRTVRKT